MLQNLSDFDKLELTFDNETRTVFRKGQGPAVIVMHEIPGIHPGVVRLANAFCNAGLSVWLPSLLGKPGKKVSIPYIATSLGRACVMQEFTVLATNKNSPVTSWLRLLAQYAHSQSGGPGVGAIGMCLTGGFALAMMIEEAVLAPVVCNPSLPFALTPSRQSEVGVDENTLEQAKARSAEQNICLLGLRFTNDIFVPSQRFQRLREAFGSKFLAIEIDSSIGNPHGINPLAHSVLGVHYVDHPGHPTVIAESQTVAFIRDRLIQSQ
ncbi:MAG: dienelactone hydrolase [Microcystis sp. Msp_OC_L_20101000_S702]|jgi:dienelactone hydrolase|uniref:Dienelactone hydrolase n=1 Tax=Microcystis aeruginosa Ma_QC_B_20070730_S2 TaxID=2486256 RepID=A0A552DA44_MICAE|nr:dienelactone hydrolase family protein [Microcystis sp. Msp_OC_L_20101000_S702]TRU04780.1 MAG: dienelactone hydrolase [Microcystis sp. Msp_OC_L_20101000_S702]TRU19078.1 MAG: dienelactone hydrolase [Microcystis aeruginosa Ma_QC_B_20070730_S2]